MSKQFKKKARLFLKNYPYHEAQIALVIVFSLMVVLHAYFIADLAQYEIVSDLRTITLDNGLVIEVTEQPQLTNLSAITQEEYDELIKPYNQTMIFGIIIWVLYIFTKETTWKYLKLAYESITHRK